LHSLREFHLSGQDLLKKARDGKKLHVQQASFGPYLILHSVPWLLLATALRMHGRAQAGLIGLALIIIVEYALLIAFLLAAHRMIQLAGGEVNLERLAFKEQYQLARAVVWRLLALFFLAVLSAIGLGLHPNYAAALWFGLDNIVHPWPGIYLPFWSAFVAVLVFLMVVEKGLGREPTFLAVARQLAGRWRHMAVAALMIVAAFYGIGIIQITFVPRLEPIYQSLQLPVLRNGLYLSLIFIFSYIRLWVTIAILTYALRGSYRENQA
jgi:hypothetical protein